MSDVPSNLIPTRITQLPNAPAASEDGLLLFIYQGNSYKIRAGDLLSVAGVPTSRQVIAGTGMSGGGQLSANVTLSIAPGGVGTAELASTGVAPSTYGSATTVPVFTVDATGRVVSAASVPVQVSGYVPESREIIAGDGLVGGGSLNANVTLSAEYYDLTPLAGNQSGSAGVLLSLARGDHEHPAVDLSNDDEVDNVLGLNNGGTARSMVADAGAMVWSGADGLYVGPPGLAGQVLVSGGTGEYTWGSALIVSDQVANVVYSGPASGPTGPTGFRSLVIDDLPSSVVTTTGTQTLTNKTLTAPVINNPTLVNPSIQNTVKLTGSGAAAYTPFIQTFSSASTNFNGYQLSYIQNLNNGSDASVDYVAYNDVSDVNSYFIDMGISSSNYTNPIYTVFPPNGAYVYTGGGLSGQASNLLLGTSNAASDITMFTGGTLLANTRATVKGNTGNVLINTTTDTGYKLNVAGTTYFGGASTFGSTVLLNADPTLALQAVTKQYVDSAVSTGFTVHPAVRLATVSALPANVYANGASGVGATLTANANGALSVDGVAVATSDRVLIQNEVATANNGAYDVTATGDGSNPYILTRAADFNQAAAGEIANNAYFFVTAGSVHAGSSFILSQTAAITVGTTALPFTQFSDQLNYVGGTNIDVTGLTISLTGAVAATNGGTGTSTVTTGDLLYGSAANTWSKLPLGIGYKSLVINSAGTQIEWNAVALNQAAAVSGQLGVGNGGTGIAAYAVGDIIYASAGTTLDKLPDVDTGNALISGGVGVAPSYGKIGLTTHVSGTLPVANGGTGAATLTGYVKGTGTSALTASATIPNTDISGLGTMSTQAASAVVITGGTINGTTIGATTATTGKFTTVTATSGISGGTF